MSMIDDDQQILTLESKLMNQQMTKLKRMTSEEDDDMGTQDRFTMSDLIMEDETLNNFFTVIAEAT